MVLFEALQRYNAWYLIILGLVAIGVTLFARRGLWGTFEQKFGIRLFPTGYYLWPPGEERRRWGRRRA
jgi:branched-chain amino acid transport system permease protein